MSELTEGDGHLLVGCYTDGDGRNGVVPASAHGGGLALQGTALELRNASWLEHFGEYVLAVSELPESRLAVLRRHADGLELLASAPTQGADACHLAVSPDQRWVAVANYTSGHVSLFAAPRGGLLAEPTCVHHLEGSGPVAGRQDSAHAHQVTWLDEQTLLVSDLGADQLRVLHVDGEGQLRELTGVRLAPGTGPRHLVVLRREVGELLLAVGGELSGEVVCVRHEGTDWAEGWWVGASIPGTTTPGASQPSGLVLFGDDLALANRGTNTVALLGWSDDGLLHLVCEGPCGGRMPRDLVEHDGLLWVANQDSGNVTALRVLSDGVELVGDTALHSPARLLFDGSRGRGSDGPDADRGPSR